MLRHIVNYKKTKVTKHSNMNFVNFAVNTKCGALVQQRSLRAGVMPEGRS